MERQVRTRHGSVLSGDGRANKNESSSKVNSSILGNQLNIDTKRLYTSNYLANMGCLERSKQKLRGKIKQRDLEFGF